MLEDEEQASSVFSAVDVYVAQLFAAGGGFVGDVCSEALGERCFSRADVACYYDALGHFFG